MLSRSRNGRILHGRRPFAARRPLHLTIRVWPGLPNLRQPAVRVLLGGLLAEARRRGLRTALLVAMPNHLHWIVVPESRAALHDATRYVFGQLARGLNALAGRRRGKVFDDRFWSSCCRSVRQAYAAFGYVLRNPGRGLGEGRVRAGTMAGTLAGTMAGTLAGTMAGTLAGTGEGAERGTARRDPYTAVDDETLGRDPFLRSVLGITPAQRAALLARLAAGPAPFVPLRVRLQPSLPGL